MRDSNSLLRQGLFGLLILSSLLGCGQETDQTGPTPKPGDKTQSANRSNPESSAAGPTDKTKGIETWDVIYLEGVKAGYMRTVEQKMDQEGRQFIFTQADTRLEIKRFNEPVQQDLIVKSFESPDGDLVACEVSQTLGPSSAVTHGNVTAVDKPQTGQPNRQLVLQSAQGAKTETTNIPWPAEARGYFAIEQSLLRKPMQTGETRTLATLQPILNQVATVSLIAKGKESTDLLSGKAELMKIECTTVMPGGTQLQSTMWTDGQGEVLKNQTDLMHQVVYRTTKEIAMEKSSGPMLDIAVTMIKVSRPLPNPRTTQKVVYRVELTSGDPLKVFPAGPTQQLKSTGPHTAELTVRSIGPDTPLPADVPRGAPPTDADRQPNSLIQSDDPRVTKLAAEVAPDEKDPWKLAVALESFVGQRITKKNFSQAFATAAEVAETLEGDCTEHAVLLAALARARGIPARVAMGLIYVPRNPNSGTPEGFAYHMWNELYIRDRWIPMDGGWGQGGIGADHIKLAESNLQGASAYASFLPVAQVLGKLKIDILQID